uniref:Uncharacterized protein n=1 Tax=Rhipicephalus zambeziensis TaxID=60191 RepID=A0A224YJU2_9ACAR
MIKMRCIVICVCHRPSIRNFRKFHRANVAKIRKIHLEFLMSRAQISAPKFKNETSTLIFSANNELVIVKHMALELSECCLSI